METKYVKVNKSEGLAYKQSLRDADNSAVFVPLEDYVNNNGAMPEEKDVYLMACFPDSEFYSKHPDYSELAYFVEEGLMIPLAWEQFIPMQLMNESE